eukprot:CAMPEP_0115890660 /NCGR_PEP_ID=MMETSP0287-20121206/33464_1 /TAXON_ID=412157 /ORGANISM="Chrysochromulina rotalis, Strain UIO044" /LENGTH=202 /DNA_ID=CAMNT_0003347435 /DNA_START=248 /DNA_END=856 /DNA_ORIENTATION=+
MRALRTTAPQAAAVEPKPRLVNDEFGKRHIPREQLPRQVHIEENVAIGGVDSDTAGALLVPEWLVVNTSFVVTPAPHGWRKCEANVWTGLVDAPHEARGCAAEHDRVDQPKISQPQRRPCGSKGAALLTCTKLTQQPVGDGRAVAVRHQIKLACAAVAPIAAEHLAEAADQGWHELTPLRQMRPRPCDLDVREAEEDDRASG